VAIVTLASLRRRRATNLRAIREVGEEQVAAPDIQSVQRDAVTLGGCKSGIMNFINFVTLAPVRSAGGIGRIPGGSEGRVAVAKRIGRLAARARATSREGDIPRRGEGDDEGDSFPVGPFAFPARPMDWRRLKQGASSHS
jgi:hypothetical protein